MIIEFMVHHQGGEGGYDSSPNGGIGREGAGHFAPASHRDRPTHAPTHPPNHPRTQPPTPPPTPVRSRYPQSNAFGQNIYVGGV